VSGQDVFGKTSPLTPPVKKKRHFALAGWKMKIA
jgi:hypothetical protein